MSQHNLPVAIIGGGPIGLAAAAHLAKRKIPFYLFEAGESVGANILSWKHVRLFSPWKYTIDNVAKDLLSTTAWKAPNTEDLPTGEELVNEYLRPLSKLPTIARNIHLSAEVIAIHRKGMDKTKTNGREQKPFVVKVQQKGKVVSYEAKAIIDSSGTWNQPNPIGSGGVFAAGEKALHNHIFYGIPNVNKYHLERYKNKNIAVVGSGHSALNVLLDLAAVQEKYPNTQLNWILRKKHIAETYGGKEADDLKARGALGIQIEKLVASGKLNVYTPFHITQLQKNKNGIQIESDLNQKITGIDEIISNTGSRPNTSMFREIRTHLDPSLEAVFDLADLIDPTIHSCGTVEPHGESELRQPEEGFYIVGSKSYGRAPNFLMAIGYEQVRSVIAYLDGDIEGAKKVALNLPQTGVCSSSNTTNHISENTGCCATLNLVETANSYTQKCCG